MGDMIKISFIIMGIFVTGFLFMSGFEQNAFATTLTSIQSGNWEDDSTWVGAFAPTETDDIVINGGHVVTISSPTSSSGAISINSGGTLDISNSRALSLLGNTITNNGDINLSSTGAGTALNIDGTVTLTGEGTISMSNFAANRIVGVVSGLEDDTLVNVNNKIQGSGDLGGNALTIDNQAGGIIEANQSAALTVDPVNSGGLTNTGIMRAVGSGTLELRPATYANTLGLIEASDTAKLVLTSGPIIDGGRVFIKDTAELDLKGTIQADLLINSGIILNNPGSIIINNSIFTVFNFGVINNSGTIINNSDNTIFNFAIINNSNTINNSGKIINCGIYTGNLPSGNVLLPCIIFEDTTLIADATIQPGISMTIDSGAVLTINPGVTLIIPSGQSIIIKDGSGVLIKDGGTLIVLQ